MSIETDLTDEIFEELNRHWIPIQDERTLDENYQAILSIVSKHIATFDDMGRLEGIGRV